MLMVMILMFKIAQVQPFTWQMQAQIAVALMAKVKVALLPTVFLVAQVVLHLLVEMVVTIRLEAVQTMEVEAVPQVLHLEQVAMERMVPELPQVLVVCFLQVQQTL